MVIKDIYDCKDFIKEIRSDHDKRVNKDIIKTEINASDQNLDRAKRDLSYKDHSWATIKAYYSMRHAANAFLRSRNILVKNHRCVYFQLEVCAKKGLIDPIYVTIFKSTLEERMEANYDLVYDESTANEAIAAAADTHLKYWHTF